MVDQTDASDELNRRLQPPTSGPVVQPARWYYLSGEERTGPIGLPAIRRAVLDGKVTGQTLVWADGMPDWLPAGEVPALVPPTTVRAPETEPGGSGSAWIDTTPRAQDEP